MDDAGAAIGVYEIMGSAARGAGSAWDETGAKKELLLERRPPVLRGCAGRRNILTWSVNGDCVGGAASAATDLAIAAASAATAEAIVKAGVAGIAVDARKPGGAVNEDAVPKLE